MQAQLKLFVSKDNLTPVSLFYYKERIEILQVLLRIN